jgi:hypothetical protein
MASHPVGDDEQRQVVVAQEAVFVGLPDRTRVRHAVRGHHESWG